MTKKTKYFWIKNIYLKKNNITNYFYKGLKLLLIINIQTKNGVINSILNINIPLTKRLVEKAF